MSLVSIRRNDSPAVGDFYFGAPSSDLGKTFAAGNLAGFGLALSGLPEGFGPSAPDTVTGTGGVAFGQFSFADATIGMVTLFAILWWFSARGMRA